jgi:hypothetical protein
MCRLQCQGWSQAITQTVCCLPCIGLFLGSLFLFEVGGYILLRNVGWLSSIILCCIPEERTLRITVVRTSNSAEWLVFSLTFLVWRHPKQGKHPPHSSSSSSQHIISCVIVKSDYLLQLACFSHQERLSTKFYPCKQFYPWTVVSMETKKTQRRFHNSLIVPII